MKKFLLISCLIMFASTGTWAFGGDRGGDRGMRHLDKMTKHLSLTDEQQEKIKVILDENKPEKKGDRKGFKKEFMELDPGDRNYQSELEKLAEKKHLK